MTARLAGILVGLAALAAAAPALAGHAILVLPVDGSADAAARAKLTGELVKLARSTGSPDGQVTRGDTTFADAALAVGCDPKSPRCSDLLLATLAIDELIWGTADRDAGQIKLVVHRADKAAAPRELTATFAATDSDRDREARDAQLAPLFRPVEPPRPAVATTTPALAEPLPLASSPGEPSASAPLSAPAEPTADSGVPEHRDRNRGIALTVSGGVALAIGLALWIDYASLQSSIDHHATHDLADFADLRSVEDRAQTVAIGGDILVPVGLAIGAAGAYFLYRSRSRSIAIRPASIGAGKSLGLTLTITGSGL